LLIKTRDNSPLRQSGDIAEAVARRALTISRRTAPELLQKEKPLAKIEGAGKAGCLMHPQPRM
jgi:hypothetical protein